MTTDREWAERQAFEIAEAWEVGDGGTDELERLIADRLVRQADAFASAVDRLKTAAGFEADKLQWVGRAERAEKLLLAIHYVTREGGVGSPESRMRAAYVLSAPVQLDGNDDALHQAEEAEHPKGDVGAQGAKPGAKGPADP